MTYPIPMIFQLFRPNPRSGRIAALYGAIVAQARRPAFYRDFGVPDTVNGRFEMVLMHTLLVMRRLRGGGPGRDLGQGLFDHFCADMDATLREWGVGDLAVPKQMRRVGEAFYSRQAAYEAALAPDATGDADLVALLGRIFAEGGNGLGDPGRLAAYIRQAVDRLARQSDAAVAADPPDFPDPETT